MSARLGGASLLLLILTAISGFSASATNATLSGRVVDDEGAAVIGLPLTLNPSSSPLGGYGGALILPPIPPLPGSDNRPTLHASSGRDGSFTFEGATGAYNLNSGWE